MGRWALFCRIQLIWAWASYSTFLRLVCIFIFKKTVFSLVYGDDYMRIYIRKINTHKLNTGLEHSEYSISVTSDCTVEQVVNKYFLSINYVWSTVFKVGFYVSWDKAKVRWWLLIRRAKERTHHKILRCLNSRAVVCIWSLVLRKTT